MKFTKKNFPLLLLLGGYLLFCNMTCEPADDEFPPNYLRTEELIKLEAENIDFSGNQMIVSSEKIKKEAYVIGVKCFTNIYEQWGPEDDPETNVEENVVSSTAHFDNVEKDFDIITVNDFDDTHLAGSSVRDFFLKTNVKKGKDAYSFSFMLILRKVPEPGVHSFKIVYTLKPEDKTEIKVIEEQTDPIELF